MGLLQKHERHEEEELKGVTFPEAGDSPDNDAPDSDDVLDQLRAAHASRVADGDDTDADGDAGAGALGDDAEGDDGDLDADADKPVPEDEPAGEPDDEPTAAPADELAGTMPSKRKHIAMYAALVAVAVIVAGIVGFFIGSGGFAGQGVDSAAVSEGQLDATIASYTYNGERHDISVRDAIESQYELETAKTSDGSYTVPSAEVSIAYARNEILLQDAASRGIEVSDDEANEYAEQNLGTSDYATIAEQYQVSEDQARRIVRESATVDKLYRQVVPDAADTVAPTEPTAPEDGNGDTASAEYASYIISLASDEWDAETGTWARTDGPYYAALSGEDFTADSATYNQAMLAYYVAYQAYIEGYSSGIDTWNEYANELYSHADITVYGLYQ